MLECIVNLLNCMQNILKHSIYKKGINSRRCSLLRVAPRMAWEAITSSSTGSSVSPLPPSPLAYGRGDYQANHVRQMALADL
jgi:hypothetical protein